MPIFKRVSSFVARAEKRYRSRYTPDEVEERFFGMMQALEFLPNSPTLMNAGTPLGQLAACFVLADREIEGIPEEIKNISVTAFDVAPIGHLKIQAAFQRATDNAVSKTVNLPESASPDDIGEIYRPAFEMRCKGIAVYRYGSRKGQVLTFGGNGGDGPTGPV